MRAEFEKIAEKVRNWGRWGSDDQRGTLNHIGPEALQRAAAAATQGKLFNLGLRFDRNGPQLGGGRFNPMLYMTVIGKPMNPEVPEVVYSDDVIHMPLQSATQWDALAHVHYDGVLYNNCKACDVLSVNGASRNGIEHLAEPGIMSRGVLLDIARLRGVDILPSDYAVSVDDLNEACAKENVSFEPGDILLLRTGHIRRFTIEQDRQAFSSPHAGLSHRCAEWIHDKKIAAVCADNVGVEIVSAEMVTSDFPMPFHQLALREMGCPLGEMFNLEALSADCANDGRYAFLLAAPPLAVTGGVGSPVNPLVLK